MPLPSEGWIPPRFSTVVPAIAGAVPEPITGEYRDFAGTDPAKAPTTLSATVVQQGGQQAVVVDALDIADQRTVVATLALDEVFGAVLLDRVRVPLVPVVPVRRDDTRPATLFNACADRPVSAFEASDG